MKTAFAAICLSMLLFTAACEPVQDPWINDEDELARERARPIELKQVLRHRFHQVQTDR